MKSQLFHVSPLRKQLAVNTSAQIVARVVSSLAMFGVTLLIARKFGANGYGDYVKITTFIAFFYLISDFGLNAIFLQRSPLPRDDDQKTKTIWEDLLALRLIVSCILVVIATILLWFLPGSATQGYTQLVRYGILLYSPTILFQALITTANALFQKYLRYDLSAIAVIAGSFVSLVLVFFVAFLFKANTTVLSVVTALNIGTAVSAGLGLYLTRRLYKVNHSEISLDNARSLFFSGLPLGLTLLFNLVYFRVDSIVLTLTRQTAEVGIYGLAYKAFELTLVLPTFFMNALYPVMLSQAARATGDTKKAIVPLVVRSAGLLLASSCIVTVCLWVAAPVISLVRSDFTAGIPALQVLSLGLPFFFLSSLTMWTLIARRRQVLLAVIYAVSMCVNVTLDVVFIPQHGYMAAAWITVVSEAFVLLISTVAVIKELYPSQSELLRV